MNSEQNVPEASAPQGPPPAQQSGQFTGQPQPFGMGQSKSSRRRRRKRKNKGGGPGMDAGAAQGEGAVGVSESGAVAPQAGEANGGGMQGGNVHLQAGASGQTPFREGGSTKRWKKKFRDRTRHFENGGGASQQNGAGTGGAPQFRGPGTHEFGNRADGWSKRKGGKGQRERGPRGFVGPMDHSYRAVNGNFVEPSPSTIEPNGNFAGRSSRSFHSHNESQPIDYSQGRSVPIAADAPTRIYFFIDDLFFFAKIQETARKLGVKVAFVKNDKESLDKLASAEENERPGLIVFDLNNANAKPLTLIPKLRTKFKRTISIIGFLSQVQGELKAKAIEAGCDTVMPRSAFSQNLPNLLRRYGLEEEADEGNFNR